MKATNVCLLLSVTLLTAAQAAEKVWVGGTGDWANAANWAPSGVPLDTDTVLISNGVVNVTVDVNLANLGLYGGTLGGTNTVVVTNGVWAGGTMGGGGVTVIPAGGQWQLAGPAEKGLTERTLVNAGTVLWNGGLIHLVSYWWSDAVISNLTTGTFEVAFDGTLIHDYFSPGTVYNAGLWRKSGGTGINTIADTFMNTGTVEVQSGTMKLAGGGGGAGGFNLSSGTTLEFSGGAYTMDVGAGITGGGLVRVTGATVNFNSDNLSVAQMELVSGIASFNAYSHVGQLQFSGGTLSGTNTVVVTNGVWTGGPMTGGGVTVIPAGGQWQLTGPAEKGLTERTLVNAGSVLWDGGLIHLVSYWWSDAVISNLTTGTFEVAFDGTLVHDYFSPGTVYNAGLWRKSGGTGTNTIADTFMNTGTVEVQSGTMKLAGGGGGAGGFNLSSGTTLEFSGGTYTMDVGAGITGSGLVRVTGATAHFNGTNFNVVGLDVTGGVANINRPANLPWLNLVNGAANFNACSQVGQLQLTSGSLGGTNTVVVTNGVWTGGTMAEAGVTVIPAGGQWQLNDSGNKALVGRTLANAGTVVWSGGEIHMVGGVVGNPVLSNLASGMFEVAFDGTLVKDVIYPGTIYNAGLWRKSAGTGTTTIADDFRNSGVVEIQRGTLYCANGYTQTGTGTLKIALRGTSPGSQFGQLAVNRTATLDGGLQVSLADGFVPSVGDFFIIMTYPGRAGSFAANNAATLGLSTLYNPTNLVLIAANNALPTVTLTVVNGSTQTVCQPFKLLAQGADVDGYVTNLSILQDGLLVASAAGPSLSIPVAVDFPRVCWFTAVAQDDQGGTSSATQAVTVAACPLHVLNLGGVQTNGAFKLCMLGQLGSNYQMLASTEVEPTNWTALGLMEFTNGIWRYLDSNAPNHVRRFYRAVQVP